MGVKRTLNKFDQMAPPKTNLKQRCISVGYGDLADFPTKNVLRPNPLSAEQNNINNIDPHYD